MWIPLPPHKVPSTCGVWCNLNTGIVILNVGLKVSYSIIISIYGWWKMKFLSLLVVEFHFQERFINEESGWESSSLSSELSSVTTLSKDWIMINHFFSWTHYIFLVSSAMVLKHYTNLLNFSISIISLAVLKISLRSEV